MVRGALAIIGAPLEEKRINLQVHLDKHLPALIMDVGNMKRIILQLVTNAVEAMAEKGTLEVRTSSQEGFVELRIEDNGKGIPSNLLPHIFDTFFSTKPAGAGLGLPIVRKIIEQHGGKIFIESAENVGTKVTVRLPVAKMT